jgi:hypothetical protein
MNYPYMSNGYVAALAQNPVYNTLPTAVEGDVVYTFIEMCLHMMNLIDGARLRRYMVLHITDLFWDMAHHNDEENEAHLADLNWFNNIVFDASCQAWQNRFNVMLDQANDAEAITMLNLLGAMLLNDDDNINVANNLNHLINNNMINHNNNMINHNNNNNMNPAINGHYL